MSDREQLLSAVKSMGLARALDAIARELCVARVKHGCDCTGVLEDGEANALQEKLDDASRLAVYSSAIASMEKGGYFYGR